MRVVTNKIVLSAAGRAYVGFEAGGTMCIVEFGVPATKQFVRIQSWDADHPEWMKHADGHRFKITVEKIAK